MRKLFRSRRGSVAFATVIALVPVIGFVALGGEAGSWYVTKQRAQNAADTAAYSGALRLACTLGSISCSDTQTVDYRGKQFAAQNSFCNTGDTGYTNSQCTTISGVSQTVQIATLGTWKGKSGNFVQATVSQQQPAYIAKILGFSTITIAATAAAEVQKIKDLCGLGLGRYPKGSALTIGGNVTNGGDGCGLMSNDTVKFNSSPSFTGANWAVDAAKGCLPNGNQCNNPGVTHNYFMPTATNPLLPLDSASFNSRTSPSTKPCGNGNVNNGGTCTLSPNDAGGVYSDLTVNAGGTVTLAAGTYFFYNATLNWSGTVTNTGAGVTLVLLGDSSINISGNASVSLSAPLSNTFSSLLNGVLIDDQAPNKSKNAVTVSGNSNTINLGGVMYFPNVDVTWGGTGANTSTACAAVIANTLTMTGSAYMSTTGCATGTTSKTQVVALVP